MHSRPSVKHVLEVLEWFYKLTEKILFQKRGLVFYYPRWPPPPGLVKDHTFAAFFFCTLPLGQCLLDIMYKGRVQKKKCSKSMVFYQTRGGVSEGNKKPNPFFGKVFFQWACRIILGPPKHVLHLVCSAYVLSTAIRTALKVARGTRILGKIRPFL